MFAGKGDYTDMNFNIFKNIPVKHIGKAALGLTAAGTIALNMLIVPWEQTHLKPYLDPVGIPTACSGVTGPDITKAFREGRVFSAVECAHMDAKAVALHERGLRDAIDDRVESLIPDFTMAAFISWTYNVGNHAAAKSTLVRRINAGDLKGACDQLPRWVRAKGAVLAGLENRRWRGDAQRISERDLCLIGLDPSHKTALFERLYFGYRHWVGGLAAATQGENI